MTAVATIFAGMAAARAVVGKLQGRLMEGIRANRWAVTFSLGVLVCTRMSASVSRLISRVDQLMYSVKIGSKDNVRLLAEDDTLSIGGPAIKVAQRTLPAPYARDCSALNSPTCSQDLE